MMIAQPPQTQYRLSIYRSFKRTAQEITRLHSTPKGDTIHNASRDTKSGVTRTSYAQVESWVSPQGGVTNSSGLKPKDKNKKDRKKNPTSKRSNPLTVRLSDKDRAIIAQKAFNIGYSVNAYVRAAALGSDYSPPIGRDMVMALLAVKRELLAQGRNLNQIARMHNIEDSTHTEDETNSMLGIIAQSLLQAHRAVNAALSWGREYPEE